MLARVHVEHELRERAMQSRDAVGHDGKARTRHAPGGFKIELPESLADRHVIERFKIERSRFAPTPHFDIGRCIAALWNARMQEIRNTLLQLIELGLQRFELLLTRREISAQRLRRLHQWRDIRPTRLRFANGFGVRVALVTQAINLELTFTGPLARSLALVSIVIGGLMFMFGEAGAKRQISGIVFGGGLALFATQFLAWLF